MATKRPRYMISVDNEMFNAIEDFRFERRFQTRSEATAELIRLGLEQIKKTKLSKQQRKKRNQTLNMNCKEVNICLLKNLAIQSLLMKKC